MLSFTCYFFIYDLKLILAMLAVCSQDIWSSSSYCNPTWVTIVKSCQYLVSLNFLIYNPKVVRIYNVNMLSLLLEVLKTILFLIKSSEHYDFQHSSTSSKESKGKPPWVLNFQILLMSWDIVLCLNVKSVVLFLCGFQG